MHDATSRTVKPLCGPCQPGQGSPTPRPSYCVYFSYCFLTGISTTTEKNRSYGLYQLTKVGPAALLAVELTLKHMLPSAQNKVLQLLLSRANYWMLTVLMYLVCTGLHSPAKVTSSRPAVYPCAQRGRHSWGLRRMPTFLPHPAALLVLAHAVP
jgi:hypothetical protein